MVHLNIAEALPVLVLVILSGLISWPISALLGKKKKTFVFIFPGVFGIISGIFWTLGLLATDWGRLGFLIYGSITLGVCVGSLMTSLWLWFRKK